MIATMRLAALLAVFGFTANGASAQITVFEETFDTDFGQCVPFQSDPLGPSWEIFDGGRLEANGFSRTNGGTAWLITEFPINFPFYQSSELTFIAELDFSGPVSPDVVYSTDYDGVSDPSGFTWTTLFVDETPGGDNEPRGPIDLSSVGQLSSAYLAFRYVSAGPGAGNSPRYRLDEVRVDAICGYDFSGDEISDPWIVVNDVDGSNTWRIRDDKAYASNFGTTAAGDGDYLISASFGVSEIDTFFATFEFEPQFGDSINNLLVLVTDNWTGDVDTTTWQDITPDGIGDLESFATYNLQTKLFPLSGSDVRLAFVFKTSGVAGGEGRNVFVDNVCVDKLGGDLTLADIQVANNGAERTLTPLVSGGVPPLSYSWDLTDMGLGTSTEEVATVFVTQPGDYTYTLTVTDSNGNAVSDMGQLSFSKYGVPQNFADVRVATYNVRAFSEFSDMEGLYNALQDPNFKGAKQFAGTIQSARPDIVLVNEYNQMWIDNDTFDEARTLESIEFLQENFLTVSQLGDEPITYDYVYVAPCNTGIQSGFDLSKNGELGDGGDAFGFGQYNGRYAQIFLSKYPIDLEKTRTFQLFLWKDMPNAFLPPNPNDVNGDGDLTSYYTSEELDVFRLSSKSHWDIVVSVDGEEIHCLCSHPTPPVFDDGRATEYPSSEVADWNGLRNHDEIRFWADYVDPSKSSYIYDDDGVEGGLDQGAKFILLGDQNADPIDGDSTFNPIALILENDLFKNEITPMSSGSVAEEGTPEKTATFGLRVDYAIPSATLGIAGSFTYWLADDETIEFYVSSASDHFLVASDIALSGTAPVQLISEIQGAGPVSPLEGSFVRVQAIVTAVFPELGGFYVQEEESDYDVDSATSEALFVEYSGDVAVQIGDLVTVAGGVEESFGQTQINAESMFDEFVTIESSGNTLPANTDIELLAITDSVEDDNDDYAPDLEAYEGMLVNFPETLLIAEQFRLARFNEIKLVAGDRPVTFTQLNEPDAIGLDAHLEALGRRRITYDDDLQGQNELIGNLEGFGPVYNTANAKRMGDSITGLKGVLTWSWAGNSASRNTWRVRSNGVGETNTFENTNPRPDLPDVLSGMDSASELKIVVLNVLNFFTTIDQSGNPGSGPNGSSPRGADNQAEYERQLEKLVTSILATDADIFALQEIENEFGGDQNGDGLFAAGALVDALNAAQTTDLYEYVDPGTPYVGSDAIAVAFIYRSSAGVSVVGSPAILDSSVDERFIDTKNRPAVTVTFAFGDNCVTLANNHLKSKGSPCDDVDDPDPSPDDGTGSCNGVRAAATIALAEWLMTDPTGSGCENIGITGDLNSYASEEPIQNLESMGFTNLKDKTEYSYVFDGQVGTLDYMMANGALLSVVSAAETWHINEDEASALDYNLDFGRDPAIFDGTVPFRNSDHSPVIIGLNFSPEVPEPPSVAPTCQGKRGKKERKGGKKECAEPVLLNILLGNDDGFETPLIQSLFQALEDAGHNVIMSAPYGGRSGTSGLIEFLSPIGPTEEPSPQGTVAAGSPGVGETGLADKQYYVDSAVTSAFLYGVDVLAPKYFGGVPDLVISGPNEGQNVGLLTPHSGTMGGAVTCINRGIPSLAVSADGDEEQPDLVAELIVQLIGSIVDKDGDIKIPSGYGLNVNLPLLDEATMAEDYEFVPTQVGIAVNSVGLLFSEKLSECPFAAAFGLGSVDLPGLCLAAPYTAAGYPVDDDPESEGNVIINGKREIAVSLIEGTYAASEKDAKRVLKKIL